MKSNDLRPGMAIALDNQLYVITQFTHVTPGNLRAFIQLKLKRVSDGNTVEKRLRSGEEVQGVDLDRRECEYLYTDSSGPVFMETESYEQHSLSKDVVGDAMSYLKANNRCIVMFADGKAISIELPPSVDLKVVDTTPGIKGATATNQLKEATLETGLKTRVPPFINVDEIIKISTSDGSYLSRA